MSNEFRLCLLIFISLLAFLPLVQPSDASQHVLTPPISPLLSEVIEAHGALLEAKGYRPLPSGPRRPTISIRPNKFPIHTIITNFNNDSNLWHFTPNRVWIEAPNGTILAERYNPRDAFRGHVRYPVPTPWDDLHALYFVSQSVYSFFTAPFLFASPGFRTRELRLHRERDKLWRVLEVTYPEGLPAHSRVQQFYYGTPDARFGNREDLLLRRNDFNPELIPGNARLYALDYRCFGNDTIPPLGREGIVTVNLRRITARLADDNRCPLVSAPTAFGLQSFRTVIEGKDGRMWDQGTLVDVQPDLRAMAMPIAVPRMGSIFRSPFDRLSRSVFGHHT